MDKLKDIKLKKDQWKAIAGHFQVPISHHMIKEVVKNVVIEHLVDQGLLKEITIEELTPMSAFRRTQIQRHQEEQDRNGPSQLELERLKWEYQFKMQELQAQKEKEARELQFQKEKEAREL